MMPCPVVAADAAAAAAPANLVLGVLVDGVAVLFWCREGGWGGMVGG